MKMDSHRTALATGVNPVRFALMSDFVSGPLVAEARQSLDRVRTNMRVTIKGKDDVIE